MKKSAKFSHKDIKKTFFCAGMALVAVLFLFAKWKFTWLSKLSCAGGPMEEFPMEFPIVILRIIGYYAVASLADAQVLDRGCIIPLHSKSLSCVSMEFDDMDQAVGAMGVLLFFGVRKLKLERTLSDACVLRLATFAPHLIEVDLGHCHNLQQIDSLSKLPQLHTLTIKNCPCVAGNFLGTLRKLSLTECGLHARAMGSLTSLELKGCAITHDLHLNRDLEHLTLHNNWFESDQADWAQVIKLEKLTNLKTLDVTALVSFDNSRMAAIGLMKNLESLSLFRCPQVTDFSFLRGLDALKTLHVESNFDWTVLKHLNLHMFGARWFEDAQLQHLESQTGLRSLRLVQSAPHQADPASVLSTLMLNWPDLHTLDLCYGPTLMGSHQFPVCPLVKCLKLNFCKSITDEKLKQLMASFPNVEVFSASFTRISDHGIAFLPVHLRDLNLRGCNITDVALPLLTCMRSLTTLDVAYTRIQNMLTFPKSLILLDLSGCTQNCVDSALKLASRRQVKIRNAFSVNRK
jgi:hypothetical protein